MDTTCSCTVCRECLETKSYVRIHLHETIVSMARAHVAQYEADAPNGKKRRRARIKPATPPPDVPIGDGSADAAPVDDQAAVVKPLPKNCIDDEDYVDTEDFMSRWPKHGFLFGCRAKSSQRGSLTVWSAEYVK